MSIQRRRYSAWNWVCIVAASLLVAVTMSVLLDGTTTPPGYLLVLSAALAVFHVPVRGGGALLALISGRTPPSPLASRLHTRVVFPGAPATFDELDQLINAALDTVGARLRRTTRESDQRNWTARVGALLAVHVRIEATPTPRTPADLRGNQPCSVALHVSSDLVGAVHSTSDRLLEGLLEAHQTGAQVGRWPGPARITATTRPRGRRWPLVAATLALLAACYFSQQSAGVQLDLTTGRSRVVRMLPGGIVFDERIRETSMSRAISPARLGAAEATEPMWGNYSWGHDVTMFDVTPWPANGSELHWVVDWFERYVAMGAIEPEALEPLALETLRRLRNRDEKALLRDIHELSQPLFWEDVSVEEVLTLEDVLAVFPEAMDFVAP